jgi:hypothetical protein
LAAVHLFKKILHNTKPGNQFWHKTLTIYSQNIKLKTMKKYLAIAFVALSFAACSNRTNDDANRDANSDMNQSSTTTTTSENATDNTMNNGTATAYSPTEGDVKYMNGKLMVMRNGNWVETSDNVTMENGVVISTNGRVTRENQTVVLQDGEVVNRSGNFFDRTGRAIDNAWDATKEGAKEVGRDVKDAANNTGDALSGDRK